ncbi:MAG: Transcriptional regulatory protein CusR [Verrucomicrobia bacterium ADurb.Bin006]|nr:MAG: Transcriptional regulatory protein CusR [Verrucomicrobia bacterium ADurb.Bin006]
MRRALPQGIDSTRRTRRVGRGGTTANGARQTRARHNMVGRFGSNVVKVLVIEDEKKIASFVRKGLEAEGFVVEVSHHGDEGYMLATSRPYDVAVFDIMLPGRDGLSILRNLRDRKIPLPVILLTARGELNERLEGLNLGADDYLTKPFYIEELVARIHAVTRRAAGTPQGILSVGDLSMNLLTREVKRGEAAIELTPREFTLLEHLMRSPGRVLTRAQICERVWEYDFDPGTNLVEVYIQRLRKKVDAEAPVKLIETVRGVGYRLKPRP